MGGRYSPVGHLASGIWLNHDPMGCWMVWLNAYADTSGHQESDDPLVVAGMLATHRQWRRFEREWERLLEREGIPYLHMKDFAPSRPPYEEWKGDEARRKRFLANAAHIIGENVARTVTLYISPQDFNEVNGEYQLGEFWSGAYPIVAGGCLMELRIEKERLFGNQPIKYFIEQGDGGQARFLELIRRPDVGIDPIPLKKKDESGKWLAPFQAADFVAYEVALEWKRRGPDRTHGIRGALKGILEEIHPFIGEFPPSSLIEVVRLFPDVFPRRIIGGVSASPSPSVGSRFWGRR